MDEYYDESEFVTTMGNNKYRVAAPVDHEDTQSIETVEAVKAAPVVDTEAAMEEPVDEYYDDSEFVSTMGSNKNRAAAPIEAVEVVPVVDTEVASEEPADDYYDDSEFVSTMGNNRNQAAAPIDATPTVREDTNPLSIETAESNPSPNPIPIPAGEEAPLLSPAYEDDYNNDFASPESSPKKLSVAEPPKSLTDGKSAAVEGLIDILFLIFLF